MGRPGIEPGSHCLRGRTLANLSYRPVEFCLAPRRGFEPLSRRFGVCRSANWNYRGMKLVVHLGLEPSMPVKTAVLQTAWCTRTREPKLVAKTKEAFGLLGIKTSRCLLSLSAQVLHIFIPENRSLIDAILCSTSQRCCTDETCGIVGALLRWEEGVRHDCLYWWFVLLWYLHSLDKKSRFVKNYFWFLPSPFKND